LYFSAHTHSDLVTEWSCTLSAVITNSTPPQACSASRYANVAAGTGARRHRSAIRYASSG
jgi:hypothetical protein